MLSGLSLIRLRRFEEPVFQLELEQSALKGRAWWSS